MTEIQNKPNLQSPIRTSKKGKEKVIQERKREVGNLEKKISNIKELLTRRPDDKFLNARLKKLENRKNQLKELNDNGTVTIHTTLSRLGPFRFRYFV